MERKNQNLKNKEKSAIEQVFETLVRHRTILTVVAGSVIVALLVAAGVVFYVTSQDDKASQMYDVSMNYINNLQYITNADTRSKVYNEAMNNLHALMQTYPSTVSATRARLFMGKAYFEDAYRSGKQESIDQALQYYHEALNSGNNSFYKALGAIGVAQCSEQKGNKEGFENAFEYYRMVAEKYSDAGFTPLAVIGMARTKEMLSDINSAIAYYTRLAKEYPTSVWAKYAKGKLFYYEEPYSSIKRMENPNKKDKKETEAPFISPQ